MRNREHLFLLYVNTRLLYCQVVFEQTFDSLTAPDLLGLHQVNGTRKESDAGSLMQDDPDLAEAVIRKHPQSGKQMETTYLNAIGMQLFDFLLTFSLLCIKIQKKKRVLEASPPVPPDLF